MHAPAANGVMTTHVGTDTQVRLRAGLTVHRRAVLLTAEDLELIGAPATTPAAARSAYVRVLTQVLGMDDGEASDIDDADVSEPSLHPGTNAVLAPTTRAAPNTNAPAGPPNRTRDPVSRGRGGHDSNDDDDEDDFLAAIDEDNFLEHGGGSGSAETVDHTPMTSRVTPTHPAPTPPPVAKRVKTEPPSVGNSAHSERVRPPAKRPHARRGVIVIEDDDESDDNTSGWRTDTAPAAHPSANEKKPADRTGPRAAAAAPTAALVQPFTPTPAHPAPVVGATHGGYRPTHHTTDLAPTNTHTTAAASSGTGHHDDRTPHVRLGEVCRVLAAQTSPPTAAVTTTGLVARFIGGLRMLEGAWHLDVDIASGANTGTERCLRAYFGDEVGFWSHF